MSLIQVLLTFGSLACLVVYLIFFRTILRDRLFVLALFTTAVVAVMLPELTTDVARFLGVGRGTDLILYLFILTSVFVGLLFYNKLARIERVQTEVLRELAIRFSDAPKR